MPSPIHLPGSAANAALMLVTAGLAHTYARRGVRVVGVNPGVTNTERVSGRMQAEAKRAGISEAEARVKAVQGMALGTHRRARGDRQHRRVRRV